MNIVKGEGPKKCLIAFVGEAPGTEEERLGRPFIGTAGNILNQKLHLCGISRQECYITNLVKLRPSRYEIEHTPAELETIVGKYLYPHPIERLKRPKDLNDFSIFWERHSPTKTLLWWKDRLLEEIDNLDTNIVVALGANALWALTSYSSIGKWRGSVLECKLPSGRIIKVIGTYHPAAVARDWSLGAIMQFDLIRAVKESKFPEIIKTKRTLIIAPTFNDLSTIIADNFNRASQSFDIETSPGLINCISFAWSPDWAISIPTTKYYWGDNLRSVISIIYETLTNRVENIGQNISYDIQYLVRFFGILPTKPWYDTMIAQHSIYSELPKGLAFLASIYTNEMYYKDDLKMWIKGASSDEKLWEYNARDAAVTFEVKQVIDKELGETGNRNTYDFTMKLLEPLIFMMLKGVKVDLASQEIHKAAQQNKIEELTTKLKAEFGDINPLSPKQVGDLAYNKLGLKPITKKGKVTTSKDAIKKLAIKHEGMQLIADIRSAHSTLSNYGEVSVDAIDSRLRCSFNPAGTETRRLSSSEGIFGSGRNLQNWPKRMRDMIIPDDRLIFTEADLSGAESRVVAYLSEDPVAIKIFETGGNIHKSTACMVFNMTPEAVDIDKKICEDNGTDTKSKYFISKKLRHSIEKAGTWVTVGEQLGIPASEAKTLVNRFHSLNPNLLAWFRRVEQQLRANRTITTPFGDKRIFFGHFGQQMVKDAVAHIAQDVVGKVINTIIVKIYETLCKDYKDIDILLQVHDSILLQHLPEHKDLIYSELSKMANSIKIPYRGGTFSIPVTMKSGDNWRDLE